MNWNSLKIFLAIARHGSLSGAAHELAVNHSTIFRRLNAFEKEIGGKLFERINNHYELSTLGHELLHLSKNIEDSVDGISRHIIGKDYQPKGVVKVTAPSNLAYRYLPKYLAQFSHQYPDIHIELLVSNLELNMSNRQADIAVRATPAPPEHLIGKQVSSIGWSFYCGASFQSEHPLPTKVEALANHTLIGSTGALNRLPGFVWLEKNYSEQIIARADDLTAMSYLAESGMGIALLPNDQSKPELTRLFPLEVCPPSHLWLLTHTDLRNVERIKLVMQFLSHAFSNEPFNQEG